MKIRSLLWAAAMSAAATLLTASTVAYSADSVPSPDQSFAAPVSSDVRFDDLDFRDASLRDALSLIGASAGLNLAASDEASKIRVSIQLHNVTAYEAVQALCQTNGLYFKKPVGNEVGIVTTVKEFQDGLTVFREEKTQVYTLLYPNTMDLAVAIRDLYGSRVRLSLGKEGLYDETDELQKRFTKFNLLDSRSSGLATFSSGGSNGSSSNGSGGGGGGGNSSSSRTTTSAGSSSGTSLLGNLAERADTDTTANSNQVPNELRDLTPDQLSRVGNLIRQNGVGVGVDAQALAGFGQNRTPIYVSVINHNNQVMVRTSDPSVLEEIDKLKTTIDVPTPQVLLEVKVLSIDLTDGFHSIFDFQFNDGHNATAFSTGSVLPAPASPPVTIGGSSEPSPFALNPNSLIYQYVNDNFQMRMQLLQNTNRVTTMATPLLLVANNEVSRVFIGENYPIVQGVTSQSSQTQGSNNNTSSTPITYQPVGTQLLITPNINADHTVTLRLIQETSEIIPGGASIPIITSSTTTTLAGAVTSQTVTNQPIDVVSAKTITGTLIAKDGLSLALGGLINEGVQDTREEVPVLGQLPLVGTLFRRQVTGRFRNEVVVVIRPFILSTPSDVQAVSKEITDANIIHPKSMEIYPAEGKPIGGINTYLPHEVLRPNPPHNDLERIFRFHSVLPEDF